jgi:hypothetical protein
VNRRFLFGPLIASLALTTCLAAIIIPAIPHIDLFPPEPPPFTAQDVAFVLGLPGIIMSVLAAVLMNRYLDTEPRWISIVVGFLFNTFSYWLLFASIVQWWDSRKHPTKRAPFISLRG